VSLLLFPDNTVLINFALIKRMDLLERIANGKGRWCATVAGECAESGRKPGLEALGGAGAIFGDPWRPESQAEWIDIRVFRDDLASPGDSKFQHLGEAETLAIMTHRAIDGLFVTDDMGAARLASKHQIRSVNTWRLLHLAHSRGFVDAGTLWGYVQTLRSAGRGSPPGVYSRTSLEAWLASAET
jgi:predicted nucleic acid-binding protein